MVVDVSYTSVNLTRTPAGWVAEINGEAVDLTRAVNLLQTAERVWLLEEVLALEPGEVAVIGNAVARQLHIELGTLGYKNHYQLASDALAGGGWAA
ncbi:hypothetical protein DKM44_13200 [Deinococcus irradiatisoli]|uniref:Uncharacterized protein n=1 Tax=Deinococcus irradiatisoli TaxID=2202254 RepID=A0A2Z3JGA7_9DEIO|nr:hypothetical protein [Deinococcus irradiatisoli]AWN24072.1 hypothetical protein DKM44_13200 [Deinococcus irradiatisoli]